MELSLQKKVNRRTLSKVRQAMIENEKLRIGQRLNYERFQELYDRYGANYSEEEFARYGLDIEYSRLSAMRRESGQEGTYILTQEVVTEEEIKMLKHKVKAYFGLDSNSKLYYENFEQIYNMFGGRLSQRIFCERVLRIKYSVIESMRSPQSKIPYVYFESSGFASTAKIEGIRNKILVEYDLHIGDPIDLALFNELYNNYGSGLGQKEFYERVLEMPIGSLTKLNTETIGTATLFANHVVDQETLYNLRERVILENDLKIGGSVTAEQFEELFKKYGGILSRELFGEEILDISEDSVKTLENGGQYAFVLQDIEVLEYIADLKNRIAREKCYDQNASINYVTFQELYQEYGIRIEGKMFATKVLEITGTSFDKLKSGNQDKVVIFQKTEITDKVELRRKIIAEEFLHYGDRLTYAQMHTLRQRYAPNMVESTFVSEVLGADIKKFRGMKFSKKEYGIQILLDERLPNEEELETLKWQIIRECKLHTKDEISYERLQELHKKYGGILPEAMFAQKILDIGQTGYNNVKGGFQPKVVVLLKTKMSDEKLAELRHTVLEENDIYPGRPVTLDDFERYYNGYEHCMSRVDFSKTILGINYDSYNKLFTKQRKSVGALVAERKALSRVQANFDAEQAETLRGYLIQGLPQEQIAARFGVDLKNLERNVTRLVKAKKILEEDVKYRRVLNLYIDGVKPKKIAEQVGIDYEEIWTYYNKARAEIKKLGIERPKTGAKKLGIERQKANADKMTDMSPRTLRARARNTIRAFEYTKRGVKRVRTYIDYMREVFNKRPASIKKEDLALLDDSIVFVQGGLTDVMLFARICVGMKDYERAKKFISVNMDNEGMPADDQARLMKINSSLSYAMKRRAALDMIMEGREDTNRIAFELHMKEVDIIRIKNRVMTGDTEDIIDPEEIFDFKQHEVR